MGARSKSWLLVALVGVAGCENEYPIAATACDDWCLATQRASCEEDYPEGCVSECEQRSIRRRFPRCEPHWRGVLECYRAAPDSDFLCVEEESQPRPICVPERVALGACIAPLRGTCLEACLRQALVCGEPERQCEAICRFRTPGCNAEEAALFACQLAQPVFCEDPEQAGPSQIPCLTEIGTLLECAGFPPTTSP